MYRQISIVTSVFFHLASLYYVKLCLGQLRAVHWASHFPPGEFDPNSHFPHATRGLFYIEATCNKDQWPAYVLWLMSQREATFRILLLGDRVFVLRQIFQTGKICFLLEFAQLRWLLYYNAAKEGTKNRCGVRKEWRLLLNCIISGSKESCVRLNFRNPRKMLP